MAAEEQRAGTYMSDLNISKLVQKINGLMPETGWLEMGRILKILSNRMTREKFKEVLTQVALSDRTAAYLVAIVTRLDSQGIKVPQGAGWRKMAEVAPVLTYENQAVIFKKVLSCTREELIEMRKKGDLTKKLGG